ncbi:hypothetical protein [Flavobacterium gelatinilyticum]|uniref:hypothetical protein n=1 Tax=Flavobacterium gelatinilyticum TaxID=3003260 RepID=UPI0024807A72|nr:hypothetical protein [Flavobacterium gelatinilyticum]
MKIFDLFKNFKFIKTKSKEVKVISIEEVAKESSAVNANIVYSREELERNEYFEKFESFDKNRIIQDNLELNGEGTCIMISGSDRYGHVKFKLYSSAKNNSEVVWSVNEKVLPKVYRDCVDKVANLFIDFIEKERGDLKKFIFEIIDTSYHPTEARLIAYEAATFRAIQNSFDEKLHKPNLNLVKREIKKEKVIKIKRKSNFKL